MGNLKLIILEFTQFNIVRNSHDIIDDVEEEISRKMKFSFDYTSATYED